MRQSIACEKKHLESAPGMFSSSSSESETPSLSMQHSEACEEPLVGSARHGWFLRGVRGETNGLKCTRWCFKCSRQQDTITCKEAVRCLREAARK
mmetsp:Transcript_48762/g.157458  ORF Transcript_48762/g.157458 Transcript_48762/m.157458 type:complete len:95 (-) Transcript_48762:4-288(-)